MWMTRMTMTMPLMLMMIMRVIMVMVMMIMLVMMMMMMTCITLAPAMRNCMVTSALSIPPVARIGKPGRLCSL